ncbi:MAG: hypothetical protein J5885_05615 [Clostridia bacterium]|nr:hypothetical protein [Clostridia bacterium]
MKKTKYQTPKAETLQFRENDVIDISDEDREKQSKNRKETKNQKGQYQTPKAEIIQFQEHDIIGIP